MGVVEHAFNLNTCGAETSGSLSLRLALSTELVPGQPGLHREPLLEKCGKNEDIKLESGRVGREGYERSGGRARL